LYETLTPKCPRPFLQQQLFMGSYNRLVWKILRENSKTLTTRTTRYLSSK